MDTRAGFAGTVGNTPLIRLDTFCRDTGCEILGKAEFMNPGGSVKDRAALGILLAAEREGRLKPGGTIVEGTAGNTGIGFLHLANERGYRCVIVMPDNQAPEKAALLSVLGAEVRIVKTVPYSDPNHYQKVAGRLADELPNAIWGNQFDNTANRDAHFATTGPEIWRQTDGRIDAFVCATGTGGTLGGVSRALKAADPRVRCVLADPMGSALYQWVRPGGWMSHQIDFKSHGLTTRWNGYRTCSDRLWEITLGRRPFMINRQPASVHLRLMQEAGFQVVTHQKFMRKDGVRREELAPLWSDISDEDLNCSGMYVIATK